MAGDPDITVIEVFEEPQRMVAAMAALPGYYRQAKGFVVRGRELTSLDAIVSSR